MRRLFLFFGALGAGGAMFGVLVANVGWGEIWEALATLSLFHAFFVGFLTFFFLLANVWRWHFVLQKQECSISFLDTGKMYLAGFPLLFFVPMFPLANEAFRTAWLKEKHHVELSRGMAAVVIDRMLEVTSNLLLVLAGGVMFLFLGESILYSSKVIAVIGFIALWVVLLLFLYVRLFQKKSVVGLFWKGQGEVHEAEKRVFRFFQLRNLAFWQGMVLASAESVVGIARAWAILHFFGKGLALAPGVAAQAFYYLALLVPVPAALGSHEALQAAGFEAFGLEAGTGAAFALLVRAAEMLFAIAGLAVLLHFSLRFFKNRVLYRLVLRRFA